MQLAESGPGGPGAEACEAGSLREAMMICRTSAGIREADSAPDDVTGTLRIA